MEWKISKEPVTPEEQELEHVMGMIDLRRLNNDIMIELERQGSIPQKGRVLAASRFVDGQLIGINPEGPFQNGDIIYREEDVITWL